jgi:excisionase family DNA binding protein
MTVADELDDVLHRDRILSQVITGAMSRGDGSRALRSGVRRAREIEAGEVPRLLDVAALAERLGVTERHVRRLVAERRIPFLNGVGCEVRSS